MPSTGARRTRSKPPCSRSATKTRLIARIAANSTVASRTPAARRTGEALAVEPEAEEHERGGREQQHRRHRLERPQLDAQVLGEDRPVGAQHRPPLDDRARVGERQRRGRPGVGDRAVRAQGQHRRRASASPASISWVTTTRVRPGAGPSSSSTTPAAPRSRWERGSSSSSSSGSWTSARQIAARCSMPAERLRTSSSPRRAMPARSSSAAIRALGSATRCRRALSSRFSRDRELAVEQRLVAEVAEPAAHLPRLARQRRPEHLRPRRRSAAAASRGSAAACSCRRRWRRSPPASPPLELERDVPQHRALVVVAAQTRAATSPGSRSRARPRGRGSPSASAKDHAPSVRAPSDILSCMEASHRRPAPPSPPTAPTGRPSARSTSSPTASSRSSGPRSSAPG